MLKSVAILMISISMLFAGECIVQAEGIEPKFTFAVISDVHIQGESSKNQRKLELALQDLNELPSKPKALVINGDLTEGKSADYEKLHTLLRQQSHPLSTYYTIGNHEFYRAWVHNDVTWSPETFPNGESEQASLQRFLGFIGESKVYYSRIVNGFSFIFLGSEHYRQTNSDIREDAFLSGQQLRWLKRSLEMAKDRKQPVFVFLHQPLPETVSGTYVCCLNNRAVVQHEELKKLLAGYPNVFFFSGHTHLRLNLPKTVVEEGFTAINSSSVAQPEDEEGQGLKKPTEPAQSEGIVVEVYEDHVNIKGRDFYRRKWIKEAQYSITLERPWYYFFRHLISSN